MANIIIPKPDGFGKTRSEQEENLRREGGRTLTDEQLSKLKFLEKKQKEKYGLKKCFIEGHKIDEVKQEDFNAGEEATEAFRSFVCQ